MKEKNLPLDYQHSSLEELTEKANSIIESLENEKNLNNSVDSYQELLKLNNLIEKKFQKSLKSVSEMTNNKIKEILKKNEK
ncbi:exonuclease VII small subunit [Candidatus Pelagibacter sp.]|nr:exonuclease VII small subunit [Candidatus Pelagibacter sp.]